MPAPIHRTPTKLPMTGFALVVDGQPKRDFELREQAVKAARELKERLPRLQVKIYDAANKQSEEIVLAIA
jgi:hypothetical protein